MDKISDMLTHIRNAQMAGKKEVKVSFSKLKLAIAKILERKGYVDEVRQENEGGKAYLVIFLKYKKIAANRELPVIVGLRQISKSGRRIYAGKREIKKVKQGYGLSIISTSKGVMTGEEARKAGLGGELICEIW